MQQGLTEEKISAVGDYTQSSYFSSREKLALTYADRITLRPSPTELVHPYS